MAFKEINATVKKVKRKEKGKNGEKIEAKNGRVTLSNKCKLVDTNSHCESFVFNCV